MQENAPKHRQRTPLMIKILFWLILLVAAAGLAVAGVIAYYDRDLPSTNELENYHPKTSTRFFDSEGGLLAEYAEQRRVYTPISAIPDIVKNSFIAAEDQNFYNHSGVDIWSIARAMAQNLQTKVKGSGAISGGSTITQQVVKNILLTNERSLARKVKEAILAVRVTSVMSKDKILEVYLNEIFLGNRSYGVVAAANNYFGKSIDQLTIEEAAMLAGMPKAPSEFDPHRNPKRALERRNYVITRLAEDGYITRAQADAAIAKPIKLASVKEKDIVTSYFAEEVRRELDKRYGKKELYEGGMTVHTTIDPRLQKIAEKALFNGLTRYDRNHGWRGPIAKIGLGQWQADLAKVHAPEGLGPWKLAAVLKIEDKKAIIGFTDGTQNYIPYDGLKWAKKWLPGQRTGGQPANVKDVLNQGDVVAVSLAEEKNKDGKTETKDYYKLEQIPDVNGAIVVMDQQSGRVLAMVGGYIYGSSQFNRATQAMRQPGSAFKPFVYLTALENGFTPGTIVNDGPIEIPQGPGLPMWTPKNYSGDFLGYIPMRKGLEKSRNSVTILLALMLGVDKVQEMAKRMGILDNPSPYYSMVLGAQETTLIRLTNAYSMLANGGRQLTPIYIDRIHDRTGKIIYRGDTRECDNCRNINASLPPQILDSSRQLVDPVSDYQIVDMLQGVVQRGTATKALELGRPLAGKTGTTNDSYDNWFMGFSPDLVVGTYIGFDNPKNMGEGATGASTALPVFIDFMREAMAGVPPKPFKIPNGVKFQKVDISTGLPAADDANPANVKMEVLNPNAPAITYSNAYKEFISNKAQSDPNGADGSINSGIY